MKVWAFNAAALAPLVARFGVEDMERMLGELIEWAEDAPTRAFLQPVWPGDVIRFRRHGNSILLGRVVVLRLVEVTE